MRRYGGRGRASVLSRASQFTHCSLPHAYCAHRKICNLDLSLIIATLLFVLTRHALCFMLVLWVMMFGMFFLLSNVLNVWSLMGSVYSI